MTDAANTRSNPFRTTPNLLTLLRICLMPFLVAAILEAHYALSFGLFVAAGLTDALDGTLARVLKQRSMLGQYLDPVADKLLLSTLFLVLMHKGLMPVTVTVLVFGRDVGILLVAAILYAAVGGGSSAPASLARPTPSPRSAQLPQCCCTSSHAAPLGRGCSAGCARCHHGADRGFGAALCVGSVAPRTGSAGQRPRRK